GQLQPKVMQVAWCDVGFGVMLGPLAQGAFPPALAVGSQPVRQHRAGDLVRSDGHQPPQSASTSRVVGELGAMGEGDAALYEACEPGAVVQAVRGAGRHGGEFSSAECAAPLGAEESGEDLYRLLECPYRRF